MKNPQGPPVPGKTAERAGRPERRRRHWDPWLGWPGSFWSGGLRLFDAWLQVCEQLWAAGSPSARRRRATAKERGNRRSEDLPWVPQVEATVIPLRRHTDPPDAEATRVSVRLPLPPAPWNEGGANVISIEAVINARARRDSGNEANEADGEETPPEPPPAAP